MDEEQQTFEVLPRANEMDAAIDNTIAKAEIIDAPRTDEDIDRALSDAIALAAERKAFYVHRIGVIETFLGFAQSEQDLAVRMARIEKFVGIGG